MNVLTLATCEAESIWTTLSGAHLTCVRPLHSLGCHKTPTGMLWSEGR